MRFFDVITIFPDALDSYFNESILKRAQNKKIVKFKTWDLRDFTKDKHRTVDDKPYGGGVGMILKVDIIFKAVKKALKKNKKTRIILMSAKGKAFTQKEAQRLSKYDQLILICGHYEGVDERVAKYIADEEISIGDYVLTGGEVPAMVICDAVTRLIPGVINEQSLEEESTEDLKEYPQYTRPEIFNAKVNPFSKTKQWKVPKILLSGHHKNIEEWKENQRLQNS